jgi:hypothetical protein
LAVALAVATPAAAQSFFSFYEMSPRQIAGMLADDGYEIRGPMWRRGDVYICDVTSVSGRSVRLIVNAHDGHVVERFASTPHWRYSTDEQTLRPPRNVARDDDSDDEQDDRSAARRSQLALGDVLSPQSRVYGNDSLLSPKPSPSPAPDEFAAPKPKHAIKKHRAPVAAKVSPVAPDATPSPDAAKPTVAPSSVAAVAPSSGADVKKPAEDAVKPVPPAVAKPTVEIAPEPAQSKPEPEKRAAANEAERPPAPAPEKPKVNPARKKINDLPVGTLD